jgi:hypothetical protein
MYVENTRVLLEERFTLSNQEITLIHRLLSPIAILGRVTGEDIVAIFERLVASPRIYWKETEHGTIKRTRCWDTHSQASESAVDATSRSRSLISGAKSALLSGESSAAVIFVSPNTS